MIFTLGINSTIDEIITAIGGTPTMVEHGVTGLLQTYNSSDIPVPSDSKPRSTVIPRAKARFWISLATRIIS